MRRNRHLVLALAACSGLFGASACRAIEYTLDGNLSVGQQLSNNIILSSTPRLVWGSNLNLDAKLTAAEPNWQVSGRTRLDNYFYVPTSGIDRQNQYVDVRGFYLTERSRYDLTGNFTDDYILSSQSDPLLGFVQGRIHRSSWSASPTWTFNLSEQTQASLGYNYSRSEYSGTTQRYPNADNHVLFSQFSYRQTERLTLEGGMSYSSYQGEMAQFGFKNSITYYNLNLGVKYTYDPSLDLHLSGGGQYSQSESETQRLVLAGYALTSLNPPRLEPIVETVSFKTPAQDSFGPVFKLGATKRFDQLVLDFSYDRQISPSINGALFKSDTVGLTVHKEFQPGLNGSIVLNYNHQSYPSQFDQIQAFSYYRAEGSLHYAWTRQWSTLASYNYYLRQADDGKTPNQDAHSVFLTLKYEFDPLKF